MKVKVVCSDCGHKFIVEEVDGVYNPSTCPSCGGSIDYLKVPIDGSRIIAFIKLEET